MSETAYVCTLSAKSIKKAKKELNEDSKERLGAVQALKEWIGRESWLQSPTDTNFFLAFLRWGKFSQLMTRERLTNFLISITETGLYNFIRGHDPGDPKYLELCRQGIYVVLPGTDKQGRRILLARLGRADVVNNSLDDYARAIAPLIHSLVFFSEEVQVNGMISLVDFSGVTMKMLTWVGAERLKRSAKQSDTIFPARVESMNFLNTGPVVDTGMALVKPFLSEKIQKRIKVHHSMVQIYDLMDWSVLPDEYLPDDYTGPSAGSISSIIESNIQEHILHPVKRAYLKDLYSGKYGADLNNKPDKTEPAASFRKLNV